MSLKEHREHTARNFTALAQILSRLLQPTTAPAAPISSLTQLVFPPPVSALGKRVLLMDNWDQVVSAVMSRFRCTHQSTTERTVSIISDSSFGRVCSDVWAIPHVSEASLVSLARLLSVQLPSHVEDASRRGSINSPTRKQSLRNLGESRRQSTIPLDQSGRVIPESPLLRSGSHRQSVSRAQEDIVLGVTEVQFPSTIVRESLAALLTVALSRGIDTYVSTLTSLLPILARDDSNTKALVQDAHNLLQTMTRPAMRLRRLQPDISPMSRRLRSESGSSSASSDNDSEDSRSNSSSESRGDTDRR